MNDRKSAHVKYKKTSKLTTNYNSSVCKTVNFHKLPCYAF